MLGLNEEEGAMIAVPRELMGSEAVGACLDIVTGGMNIGYDGTDLRLGI